MQYDPNSPEHILMMIATEQPIRSKKQELTKGKRKLQRENEMSCKVMHLVNNDWSLNLLRLNLLASFECNFIFLGHYRTKQRRCKKGDSSWL